MHVISHSLPHRGPGASRARPRWQPYSSAVTLSSAPASAPSRSPASYLHTPASSVASSSPPTVYLNPVLDIDRFRPPSATQLSQPSLATPRDAHKARYVTRLVDQAVKSLCEIWRPDDIPQVYCAPASNPEPALLQRDGRFCSVTSNLFARNPQLPSPVSPHTQPSPFPPVSDSNDACSQNAADISRNGHLVPIKSFVHEVLRRSRTSTGVLQTALCYLEAIRARVPDALRKEQAKSQGEEGEPESSPRIVLGDIATASEILADGSVRKLEDDVFGFAAMDTMRVDCDLPTMQVQPETDYWRDVPANKPTPPNSTPLPPLPPSPSPLLCPRRTFLACLILASKFTQDRSYSNRAWAKLAGLPPREIGRCERAVGDALGWRLWVGKGMGPSTAGGNADGGRTVTRRKSVGDLLNASSSSAAPWSSPAAEASLSGQHASCDYSTTALSSPAQTPVSGPKGLRRCATEPAILAGVPRVPRASANYAQCFPSRSTASFGGMEDSEAAVCKTAPYDGGAARGGAADAQQDEDFSPSMLTPTLSYSPMSSVSSSSSDCSGDRTIQMSAFADLPTPSPASFVYAPFNGAWDNSSFVDRDFCSFSWKAVGKVAFDGNTADMADVPSVAGPTLAAIDTSGQRRVPYSLPSLSDTISFAPNYDGLYNCWTR